MPQRHKVRFFLYILQEELADILEDIELVEEKYLAMLGRGSIGQYVFLENRALLEKEKECLKQLLSSLKTRTADLDDVEGFAKSIEADIEKQVRNFEYPEAIVGLVHRKVRKILGYFRDDAEIAKA